MPAALLAGAALLRGQSHSGPIFYPDYRSFQAVYLTDDDHLVGVSMGGIVTYDHNGQCKAVGWDKLSNGRLPTQYWASEGKVYAAIGGSVWRWKGRTLVPAPSIVPLESNTVTANGSSLNVPERPMWPEKPEGPFAPPPGCKGSMVRAIGGTSESFIAAWYGDGLWTHDAKGWRRTPGTNGLPFTTVTSLSKRGEDLAVGSTEGDVWQRRQGIWKHFASPNGPKNNIYSIVDWKGKICTSSFEEGLSMFDGKRWESKPEPRWPRELVAFRDCLYVRRSTGEIDRFDGLKWTRNVFSWLPRGEASCLAVGDGKLLVGQYGGWSEYDGSKWHHYLRRAELEGYTITALAAGGGHVWVGTQERGLLDFDLRKNLVATYDDRQGLGDDWVRSIRCDDKGVMVTLFRSGAYVLREKGFVRLVGGIKDEATGIVRSPYGQVYIGSRVGLWTGSGKQVPVTGAEDLEIQAMTGTAKGLWLGTRYSVIFVPWESLRNGL